MPQRNQSAQGKPDQLNVWRMRSMPMPSHSAYVGEPYAVHLLDDHDHYRFRAVLEEKRRERLLNRSFS